MIKASVELESLIKKVVKQIKDSPELSAKCRFFPGKSEAYSLEDAAGNHAFDDYPEWFEITEDEGHYIRAFFQSAPGLRRDKEQELYIQGLIDSA